jgi:hypothetical protein
MATLSEDGKWMWDGSEWIPAPPTHDPPVVTSSIQPLPLPAAPLPPMQLSSAQPHVIPPMSPPPIPPSSTLPQGRPPMLPPPIPPSSALPHGIPPSGDSRKKKSFIWKLKDHIINHFWSVAVMAAGMKIILGSQESKTDPFTGRSVPGEFVGGEPVTGILFIFIGVFILPRVLKWFVGIFQSD